eukprot:TRINITY_DN18411_c0_g1_i1.p1 TRINITY_DN18411_c0_g1~~TRINITY_DN18411_c0_g1_i1.p1  ORF type:complete len:240 (-),score=55.59 TRINITY_DN18411_c0_g1_i1:908-1627(-)
MTSKHAKHADSADLSSIKNDIVNKARHVVFSVWPSKVVSLSTLFENTPKLNLELAAVVSPVPRHLKDDEHDTEATSSKKRKLRSADGDDAGHSVPLNPTVAELCTLLKKELLEMIEMCNTVKIWIQLNIPRIEDGNNFGVSIQEETVNELGRSEEACFSVLESIAKYYLTRAKLVSKCLKHPEIDDYRQTVAEMDQKEYIGQRLCVLDLRNSYAILHDLISKNIEKLVTPRTSNPQALY